MGKASIHFAVEDAEQSSLRYRAWRVACPSGMSSTTPGSACSHPLKCARKNISNALRFGNVT